MTIKGQPFPLQEAIIPRTVLRTPREAPGAVATAPGGTARMWRLDVTPV